MRGRKRKGKRKKGILYSAENKRKEREKRKWDLIFENKGIVYGLCFWGHKKRESPLCMTGWTLEDK